MTKMARTATTTALFMGRRFGEVGLIEPYLTSASFGVFEKQTRLAKHAKGYKPLAATKLHVRLAYGGR